LSKTDDKSQGVTDTPNAYVKSPGVYVAPGVNKNYASVPYWGYYAGVPGLGNCVGVPAEGGTLAYPIRQGVF
jgi:hypothetical protein